MNCPVCETDSEIFLTEPVECASCSEITYIDYCRCPDCNSVFRVVGGNVDEDSVMDAPSDFLESLDDIISLAFGDTDQEITEEDLKEIVSEMQNKALFTEVRLTEQNSMSELIHKCLKCNEPAFAVGRNLYRCSDCGFEWEVVDLGG